MKPSLWKPITSCEIFVCDRCSKHISASQSEAGWSVDLGRAEYGSRLDGSDIYMNICDSCLTEWIYSFMNRDKIINSGANFGDDDLYIAYSDAMNLCLSQEETEENLNTYEIWSEGEEVCFGDREDVYHGTVKSNKSSLDYLCNVLCMYNHTDFNPISLTYRGKKIYSKIINIQHGKAPLIKFVTVASEKGVFKNKKFKCDIEDLKIDDLVVCDLPSGYLIGKVSNIEEPIGDCVRWIVQKVDVDKHERRVKLEKTQRALLHQMENRKKELEQKAYELIAKEDKKMYELLKEYKELK